MKKPRLTRRYIVGDVEAQRKILFKDLKYSTLLEIEQRAFDYLVLAHTIIDTIKAIPIDSRYVLPLDFVSKDEINQIFERHLKTYTKTKNGDGFTMKPSD